MTPITYNFLSGLKSKRELKEEVLTKCEAALKTGQKICIDCSLEDQMSEKASFFSTMNYKPIDFHQCNHLSNLLELPIIWIVVSMIVFFHEKVTEHLPHNPNF